MPDNRSLLKNVQTVVHVLKNMVLLVVLVYAAIAGRRALSTVFQQISSGERVASEVIVGKEGITLKLEEAKQNLTAALNAQTAGKGTTDKPVTPQAREVLTALEQTDRALNSMRPVASQRWVYLGIEKNGKWTPNYFRLSGKPEANTNITATTDVYERDGPPIYDETIKDWKLGNIVGVLHEGKSATALQLTNVESDNGGTNWWARIR